MPRPYPKRFLLSVPANDAARWRRVAGAEGLSLDEFLRAAIAARVIAIERRLAIHTDMDRELDRYVRDEVDAAIAERSSVTCSCGRCTRALPLRLPSCGPDERLG